MLAIADKFLIAFFFVNILTPKIAVYSLSLSKALVASALSCYMVYALATGASAGSKRAALYVLVSFTLVMGLAAISVIKGNEIENISEFITPLLILLTIPLISRLFQTYQPERYLLILETAIVILAAYVIGLYMLCGPLDMREVGLTIGEVSGYTSVSFPAGAVKVSVITGGFFASGIVLALYFLSHKGSLLHILSILSIGWAVYLSYTIGIWTATVVVVVGYMLFCGTLRTRLVGVVSLTGLLLVANSVLVETKTVASPEAVFVSKESSFVQKQAQVEEGLELFYGNPILGQGLGFLFNDNLVPSLSKAADIYLEVSYVTLLATTGVIGLLCYVFIYGFYPFQALWKVRTTALLVPLLLSQLSILIAATGNPYIWSGGMGLLFVVLIAGILEGPLRSPISALLGPKVQ